MPDFRVITPDGRELVEQRDCDGFTKATQVAVRPWGFVGDFRPDLQMAEVAPGLYLGMFSFFGAHITTHL